MFHSSCVSQQLCFTAAVFHSSCVSQQLCFTAAVFHSSCVSQQLCFTAAVFHSSCVSQQLCFTAAVFHSSCVSQQLCFTGTSLLEAMHVVRGRICSYDRISYLALVSFNNRSMAISLIGPSTPILLLTMVMDLAVLAYKTYF